MAKIYTKTGDNGTTSLAGGRRVKKCDVLIESYGTVDELNASIGVAIACFNTENEVAGILEYIQNQLFTIGGILATEPEHWGKYWVDTNVDLYTEKLEDLIDEKTQQIEPLRQFLLPGGSKTIAQLHLSRTICRRAERNVCAIAGDDDIFLPIMKYLNRLSDLLFILARYLHKTEEIPEKHWKSEQ